MNRRQFALFGLSAFAAGSLRSVPGIAAPPAAAAADPFLYVDPVLRPAAREAMKFARNGAMDDTILEPLRSVGAEFAKPRRADVPVTEERVPVGRGVPDVIVYVINARAGSKRPGILHMHGGGYIAGAAKWSVGELQDLAQQLDCLIVTVEYRLAPETRYGGSIEDNYAALRWMYARAGRIGLDPDLIAVMGESAGGGHAALLAITARDRREVPVALQVLVYPMLDDRTGSITMPPSFIGAIGWNVESNRYGWRSFLGEEPGTPGVPAAGVPARVHDLSGLPPAWIGVGAIDLFVAEDIEYAGRLISAGVATELLVVPGAFHGFDRIAADTSPARRFTLSKLNALRRAFRRPEATS